MIYTATRGVNRRDDRLRQAVLILIGLPVMIAVLLGASLIFSPRRQNSLPHEIAYDGYLAGAIKASDSSGNGRSGSSSSPASTNNKSSTKLATARSNSTSSTTGPSASGTSSSTILAGGRGGGSVPSSSSSILPPTVTIPSSYISADEKPVISSSPLTLTLN